MNQAPKQEIVVSNQLPSKASFGVVMDTKEQVYIPANIGKACNLEVGMIYSAILVPNNHDLSSKTPWLAVKIDMGRGSSEPTAQDLERAQEALLEIEYPVTADQIDVPVQTLQAAWKRGMIVRLEAKESPDHPVHVFWAATLDHV